MIVKKTYIWILALVSIFFNTAYSQNFTGELVFDLGSETICQGTLIQLSLELDGEPNSDYFKWSSTGTLAVQDFYEDIIGVGNGGSGNGDEHTFIRIALNEPGETTISVDIQQTIFSKTITVVEAPDAGQDNTIFLCNKTGTISLFDELNGTPDAGGTWSFEGGTHSGNFVVGTDEQGIYTYLVNGQAPCPDTDARVTVRNCSNPDYDGDGVPNEVDLDDDNDGILDADENAACSPSELTPTQSSVDEDFGIGPPTQNSFVSGNLTYQIGIPQDVNSNDGEYNVATATYMYNFGNQSAFWVSTDENNFWDGDDNVDGRFLSINMKTASFVDAVIYEQTDLPVTPGVVQTLSMKIANLSTGVVPSFKLQIVTSGGAVIEEVDSVEADLLNIDIWNDYTISFTPDPGVEVVTLRLINTQSQSGDGNDVGIDNILLARLECDSDLDGVPNYIDRDSDNDGIFDAVEAGFSEAQVQADGQLTGGVDLATGIPLIANGGVSLTNDNYLNLDSDGDGCSDANEAYFDSEADGTLLSTNASETQVYGIDPFDFADVVDFDGLIIEASYTYPVDQDSDSVLDYLQAGGPDLNGNSIPDACEDTADNDEDGIPDGIAGSEDLDDDNDGILDVNEYTAGITEDPLSDSNGTMLYLDSANVNFIDVNNDNVDDRFDFDLDGIINQFDVDSDNDGIYDHVEAGLALVVITGDFGQIGEDADVDTDGLLPGAGLATADLDADGLPNFLDIDADADGILDNYEAQITDGYTAPSNVDTDNNGADDAYDGIGALDPVETTVGTPDYINDNSDGDCLDDVDEAYDLDQDGVSDITEVGDVNGDGLDDAYEGAPLVAAFPNNHNPDTAEVDYREEFIAIEEEVDADAVCNNENAPALNLFNELELDDDIDDLNRDIGTWTATPSMAIIATDGTIEPSNLDADNYVFEYVVSYETSCEHTYTLNLEILEEPYVGDVDSIDGPTVCDTESVESISPFASIESAATDIVSINGIWTVSVGDASAVTLPATATDYNEAIQIDTSLLAVDDEITLTYSVGNASNADCSASIDVVVKVSSGRNAGTTPVDPVAFCVSDTTLSDPLITHLGDADEDGVWSSVDDSVSDFTALGNAFAITPSTLLPGTYTYVYFLAATTCDEATSSVTVIVNPILNAGLDEDLSATPICKGGGDFSIVSLLSGTRDAGGVWTSQSGAVVFDSTDDQGLIDVSNINLLEDDVYIYTVSSTLDGACEDAVAEITLKIVDSPSPGTLDTTINTNFCESENSTGNLFDYINDEDAGGLWTDQNNIEVTNGLFDLTGLTAADYTYTYTVAGLSIDCPEDSVDVVFTINPELVAVMTQTEDILCKEVNGQLDLSMYLDPSSTAGGKWSGGVVTAAGILDYNTANVEERYVYTVESTMVGGCAPVSAFIDIKLTEDRDAGPDPTPIIVCTSQVNSVDLFSALEITDTDGSWTGGTTEGGHLGTVLITDTTVPGDYTFTYTLPAIGTCEADEVVVALTVVTATTPTNPSNEEICEGDANPVLSVDVDAGLSANWYDANGELVAENTLTYTSLKIDGGLHSYSVYSYSSITGCESVTPAIVEFEIFGIIQESLLIQEIICEGDSVNINSSKSANDFTFQWYKDGVAISGATSVSYDAIEEGSYSVDYFNINGCSSGSLNSTRVTLITAPTDLELSLGGQGFSDFNSITATFIGDPNGEYEIDLDGAIFKSAEPNTPIVFENVSPGEHYVTVTDLNGCGVPLTDDIFVIGFPKFFTPNGDRANDNWNVLLNPAEPMDLSIFVYDRFGKLIQQVFPDKTGWDGTFAGKNMPSDDYWFLATMNDTGATYASHFTLIR